MCVYVYVYLLYFCPFLLEQLQQLLIYVCVCVLICVCVQFCMFAMVFYTVANKVFWQVSCRILAACAYLNIWLVFFSRLFSRMRKFAVSLSHSHVSSYVERTTWSTHTHTEREHTSDIYTHTYHNTTHCTHSHTLTANIVQSEATELVTHGSCGHAQSLGP